MSEIKKVVMKNKYIGTLQSGNFKYFLKNGKEIPFINGVYLTSDPLEIVELDAEVAGNHPHIRVDEENLIVDVTHGNPMEEMRAKIREDVIREMAAATTGKADRGNIKIGPLQGIGNSSTIGDAAASSNAGGSAAPGK